LPPDLAITLADTVAPVMLPPFTPNRPSSPVPRTKLLVAVRLLPEVPVSETLFRLHPSISADAIDRLIGQKPGGPAAAVPLPDEQ
jgi:hypothetical protein